MIPKYFPSFLTTNPLNKPCSPSISPLIFHGKPISHNSSKPNLNLSGFGFRHLKQTRLLLSILGSNHGDNRAMDAVLRLYEAIKNKNLNHLSEIMGHDCLCVCSFLSTFKTFSGKKQVIEFLSTVVSNIGNNWELVIQPTLHDGMTVGVSWKLECSKTHKPIGSGFSFHMCHNYQGKVLIRNVEMSFDPILHIEPSRLKMVGLVAGIIGQTASKAILKGEKKRNVLCIILALTMLFIVIKLYRS